VNRQQTVIEYLHNNGKIAVISFLQNKIFPPFHNIMGKLTLGSILIVSKFLASMEVNGGKI
jgi:hypothetical protein